MAATETPTSMQSRQLTYATPTPAAGGAATEGLTPPAMDGNNTPVTAGVGLKAAVESRGGQAIYEAQSILKELRL